MMKLHETLTHATWWGGGEFKTRSSQGCLYVHLYRNREGYARVIEAIATLYPERTTGGLGVIRFNDHPETTLDDVIRVCKLADV